MSDSHSQDKAGQPGEVGKAANVNNGVTDSLPPAAKPGLWQKIKPNIPLYLVMFKGSLPMTITLAMYQSTTVARRYTTVGYIMAMIAFFSMAMLPRAKYLEALVFNIMATCVGAALSLLAIWCGIKARQHTTPAGSTAAYNSSQAAVCAIWFFFTQWAAGAVRAKIPLLQNNVYLFSVLTMIAMTYGPRFHTMDQGISLVVELLEIFFIAFGVATGVSLLIFPVSTRTILFKKHTAYFGALRGFVKKQTAYYRSLETPERIPSSATELPEKTDSHALSSGDPAQKAPFPEREALYAALSGLIALHTEVFNDTVYAKRELAYGKLNANDVQQLFKGFRAILTPLVGIRTIIELFDRMATEAPTEQTGRASVDARANERNELRFLWGRVMAAMHNPFADIAEVIDQGLEHAGVVLELLSKPKKGNDVEAQTPGDPAFAEYMDRRIQAFHGRRSEFMNTWTKERDTLHKATSATGVDTSAQQHPYIVLHMEHLIYSTGVAVYELVLFADMKARDGTMARKRLIFPSFSSISSLLGNTLGGNPDLALDTAGEHADGKERGFQGETVIQSKSKDPQHLPPQNTWERYSNYLRAFPRLMKSNECAFGLRMALAASSVAILAYLEKTWTFYYEQKLIWTLIVILVSMSVASGESTFKLAARAIATVVAMVVSFVAWYIVDGHPAGVLVFTWLAFFALCYGFVKVPKFFVVWLCILVTIIATIGSSLQSHKLGHAAAIASGQIDYPIYTNAPYRLATVLAGCLVAYIWTLFPYPITDRSLLGEKLGDLVFLIAKFHDCGHSIASLKIKGKEGDMALRGSRGRKLQKVQHRLFHEIMTLIPALRMHALFQKFEFPIGGRFPANRYLTIMTEMTNIMSYVNLLTHSTRTWPRSLLLSSNAPESQDTAELFASMSTNSHNVTSALTLLSASVKYGIPLPPYFQAPTAVDFSAIWAKLSAEIHSEETKKRESDEEAVYSAWAVIHIVSDMTNSALGRMVVEVRELVGEVDFENRFKEE